MILWFVRHVFFIGIGILVWHHCIHTFLLVFWIPYQIVVSYFRFAFPLWWTCKWIFWCWYPLECSFSVWNLQAQKKRLVQYHRPPEYNLILTNDDWQCDYRILLRMMEVIPHIVDTATMSNINAVAESITINVSCFVIQSFLTLNGVQRFADCSAPNWHLLLCILSNTVQR